MAMEYSNELADFTQKSSQNRSREKIFLKLLQFIAQTGRIGSHEIISLSFPFVNIYPLLFLKRKFNGICHFLECLDFNFIKN